MNTLVLKLGATGDVVRSTPLLHCFLGNVTWITAADNVPLLVGLRDSFCCLAWEERDAARSCSYDLVINLEDTPEVAGYVQSLQYRQLFGAFAGPGGSLRYTEGARGWFDLSLISTYGRQEADRLKWRNRRSYQDLVFSGLGFEFRGETYLLPGSPQTDLSGDVAIAPEAGPVWPMKNWAFYAELRECLETEGLRVNVLPKRETLLQHLADIRQHRCLVSGDSLPMHLALGSGRPCVTLFNCTSPWEIYDYGLQTQLVSPLLEEFFYKRHFDPRARSAISFEQVLEAVLAQLRPQTKGGEAHQEAVLTAVPSPPHCSGV